MRNVIYSFVVAFGILCLPSISLADVVQTNPSNSFGVDYQNTTGFPKYVVVGVSIPSGFVDGCVALDGDIPADYIQVVSSYLDSTVVGNQETSCSFMVPNGWWYNVNSQGGESSILSWTEWDFAEASSSGTTTVSTSTLVSVDNPNQDYFNGVALFFALCFTVVFVFKRR